MTRVTDPADIELPTEQNLARLALQYAVAQYGRHRDHLGSCRGQLALAESNAYRAAIDSGLSPSAAREHARHSASGIRAELESTQADVDIFRAHIDAITVSVQHLL